MKAPEIPWNEADRLAALHSYEILDTDSEAQFDALTRLAAFVMSVPIALVNFIDADRQWFKSRYGIAVQETPRELSFCGHVVANETALVVKDTFTDERFAIHPFVQGEPHIRFYAGMPLRTSEGFVLGSLCAIDREPKTPTPDQLAMLALLAGQVVDQIEARRKRRLLVVQRAEEHLVTMGTLIAGLRHEINNPLAYILGNIDFSLEELRDMVGGSNESPLQELIVVLGEARQGAERVRKIVRGLGALSREQSEPIPTDIADAIDVAVNLAAHEVRHKATVVVRLAPTPPALADDSRLPQILVNLLVNAAQAFPTGDIEKNTITITSSLTPDGRVSIAVTDNGPGIPEALQRRIFDPFFTTRHVGHATGLGLSMSRGIATALGGDIVLESPPEGGATFRVVLRAAAMLPAPTSETFTVSKGGRRGRVLVIDDEPAVLSSMRRILERQHEVVVIADAREALAHMSVDTAFDVVFCDLMMAHLGGEALYTSVRAIDAALAERFIFITGGVTDVAVKRFLSEVTNERIEKPFDVGQLRGLVRHKVDARPAS